jgi:NTE family protein
MNAQPTTAFVLAGGGSLGAVEVGMLRALAAVGLKPDLIVGSSAGAINGAYFAADPTPDGVEQLERLWRDIKRSDILPLGIRDLLRLAWQRGRSGHMVEATGLRRLLERHLSYRLIEGARVPLHVVATDRALGSEVLISSGPVIDAVLASTAIPGVYPPVNLDGRELIDGGVCANTPIAAAIRLGAQRLFVLPTGFACALKRPPASPIGQALHALSLLVARQFAQDIERYAGQAALHVVPPLCPVDTSTYDYSACGALIDRALSSTREWIERGGLERPLGMPHEMLMHGH